MFKRITKDEDGDIVAIELDREYFEKLLTDTNKDWYELHRTRSLMTHTMHELENLVRNEDFNLDDFEKELNDQHLKHSIDMKLHRKRRQAKDMILNSVEQQIDEQLDMLERGEISDVNVDISTYEPKEEKPKEAIHQTTTVELPQKDVFEIAHDEVYPEEIDEVFEISKEQVKKEKELIENE